MIELYEQPILTDTEQEVLDSYMHRVEQAKAGEIEAKEVYADLYVLLKSLEELQDEVKDQAIDELERYGKDDEVERNGFKMSVVSSKRYNYKHDQTWAEFKEKQKAREKLMKQVALKGTELYDKNGEQIPAAEITFSTYIKMSTN